MQHGIVELTMAVGILLVSAMVEGAITVGRNGIEAEIAMEQSLEVGKLCAVFRWIISDWLDRDVWQRCRWLRETASRAPDRTGQAIGEDRKGGVWDDTGSWSDMRSCSYSCCKTWKWSSSVTMSKSRVRALD